MFRLVQRRAFSATARANDFAKMSVIGRIGSDYQELTSSNDTQYLKYSIACQPRKDGNTNWFNVTVFNPHHINFMTQYVKKGALVYVECDASNFTFEREDGSKGHSLSLVQREINLLKNPRTAETEGEGEASAETEGEGEASA